MHRLFYDIKNTSATTEYLSITDTDLPVLLNSLLSVLCWMNELSISQDKDIKDFIKWYQTPNKKFLYNSKLKRNNSPQTIISGIYNNLVFGTQRDFSLVQLEMACDINNTLIDIIEVIKTEKQIDLQSQGQYTKIWPQINIW